jgi:hypothetical protein
MSNPSPQAAGTSACPGCSGEFVPLDGPTHAYMESSPGCWRVFGELVAADYSSVERMAFHQVIVDAYAAQHPGNGDRRQVQSVGLHLMTLCLFLEHDVDPAHGTALHRRMIDRPAFHVLERTGPGELTVAHVPTEGSIEVARRTAYEWATAVWTTYEPAQATVTQWLRVAGFDI